MWILPVPPVLLAWHTEASESNSAQPKHGGPERKRGEALRGTKQAGRISQRLCTVRLKIHQYFEHVSKCKRERERELTVLPMRCLMESAGCRPAKSGNRPTNICLFTQTWAVLSNTAEWRGKTEHDSISNKVHGVHSKRLHHRLFHLLISCDCPSQHYNKQQDR